METNRDENVQKGRKLIINKVKMPVCVKRRYSEGYTADHVADVNEQVKRVENKRIQR